MSLQRNSLLHALLSFAATTILVIVLVGICVALGFLVVVYGSPVLAMFIIAGLIAWAIYWLEHKA